MDQELIEKFIEVTGESEATARQYLSLADGNVETAISLMFDGSQAPEPLCTPDPEPEVRPPILPMQEVLVPSGPICSLPRLSTNVFDRFRDFAVETQRQEEEMARKVAGVKQISYCKSKRLEDLFRPPCDILFLGSFMEAREHAKSLNRWLLVNIQNSQEFSCQILNRDVWSNQQIQEIVKDHFVLWQVLSNTSDGNRYVHLYDVYEYPYLAVIDPRTGECMKTYNHITVDILISALNDMLSSHPSPECVSSDSVHSKEWNTCTATTTKECSSSNSSDCSNSTIKPFKHTIDNLNDTDNINIKNDLTSIQSSSTNISLDTSENISKKRKMNESNEANQETSSKDEQSYKLKSDFNEIKSDNESVIRLCLRLPNGKKETVSMSTTDTVEKFINTMENMGYASTNHTYLVPFPKTNIGALPPQTYLSDTILFPANTVFITKI
ncbi:UBX domain-containing protein 7 [Apis mellifera carnica]|uniref:UBX domain-containing protein 7 n=1 Tax=Apis mellifera TaxID=7460 RepID=A0A7M7LSQ1_APIME|nr:UBX domain-containing protein 7 [Apis mellifera]KAG9435487.1 UBX domain-containing protein 7 [Apis mellifera carnica]|eukprot:XP_006568815.1 UBX domain-containing protein 7 [Apis mellifera]